MEGTCTVSPSDATVVAAAELGTRVASITEFVGTGQVAVQLRGGCPRPQVSSKENAKRIALKPSMRMR